MFVPASFYNHIMDIIPQIADPIEIETVFTGLNALVDLAKHGMSLHFKHFNRTKVDPQFNFRMQLWALSPKSSSCSRLIILMVI